MANKGHNVTVVSPDAEKNPAPNVHYLHLETINEILYGSSAPFNYTELMMTERSPIEELNFSEFGAMICKCKKLIQIH